MSVFHNIPGVPRVKMERFTGLAHLKDSYFLASSCHDWQP
jgi:hypothetical protein